MMASKKPITRDYLLTLLQRKTQKQVAALLGIGERTIRRIKNEPGHKVTRRVSAAVSEVGEREYKRLRRVSKSDVKRALLEKEQRRFEIETAALEKAVKKLQRKGVDKKLIADFKRHHKPRPPAKKLKGGKKITIPRVAIIPPYERVTRVDPTDPKGERRIWTDTLVFDVRELSIENIVDFLKSYRSKRKEYAFRLVFGIPKDYASTDGEALSADDERARMSKHFVLDAQGGTEWSELTDWSIADLKELLQQKLWRDPHNNHNFFYINIQPV